MDAELLRRIRRVYAAIAAGEETDPKKLRAKVTQTRRMTAMFQDFHGASTEEELTDHAYLVIHNIASVRDYMRRWAARKGKDKTKVSDAFRESPELQIITDLSNNDKHEYPPRDGGHSGKYAKVVGITRVMRLATRAEVGSTSAMTLRPDGTARFTGDGPAKAIVTGDVVDKDNNSIGDLNGIAAKAVEVCEGLLREFEITADEHGT